MTKCVAHTAHVLLTLAAFSFAGFVFTRGAAANGAADLTVTCNLSDCTNGAPDFCTMAPSEGSPLFNEFNALPGDSVVRKLAVENTGSCDCESLLMTTSNQTLSPGAPADFPTRLFTVIEEGASDVYGIRDGSDPDKATDNRRLSSVFAEASINLGSLNSGQTKQYNWVLTFDPDAGNDYQDVQATFDFSLAFNCGTGSASDDGGGDDNDDDWHTNNPPSPPSVPSPPPTVLGLLTGVFAPLFPPEEEVAGVEAQKPEEPTPPAEGAVSGTGICVDPWWWWLIFIVEILALAAIYKMMTKDHINKRYRFYAAQILVAAFFVLIFYKYFCPWWDYLAAALVGFIWLLLTKRKFDKLEEQIVRP